MIKWTQSITSTNYPIIVGLGSCDLCPSKAIGIFTLSRLKVCNRHYWKVIRENRADRERLKESAVSGRRWRWR